MKGHLNDQIRVSKGAAYGICQSEMRVDSQDLINFVAEYVRSKKVSQLENMNSDEILGVE